jgi:hypothetical protein
MVQEHPKTTETALKHAKMIPQIFFFFSFSLFLPSSSAGPEIGAGSEKK